MDKLKEFAQEVKSCKSIVFFGGAGVSTESGIPDFRSTDGLYNQKYAYPPETILSHSFFINNQNEFYRFYRDKMIYPNAKPNVTHTVLAKLEKLGKLSAIVTQNIDGLHELAGSNVVYNLHGSIYHNHCMRCGKSYPLSKITSCDGVPHCDCSGVIKPDVVLYEEPLPEKTVEKAIKAISDCDLLIVGGTSLTVYPAASFIDYRKGKLVLINKSKTSFDSGADLLINASLGGCFSYLEKELGL